MSNEICPRTQRSIRTMRCRSLGEELATGMKSMSSPTPPSVKNLVIRMAVSGR